MMLPVDKFMRLNERHRKRFGDYEDAPHPASPDNDGHQKDHPISHSRRKRPWYQFRSGKGR